jgi:hypothetical protein
VTPPPGLPIDLGADPARELARQELARAVYEQAQPPLLLRLLTWLQDGLDDLLRAADRVSPGGSWGLLVLLVALVVVVVVVRRRIGPAARSATLRAPVFGDAVRSAAEHRRTADEHTAAGRHDDAVRERMRAVVRGLEERTIIEPRRGRTAGEAAREGGRVLPAVAASLAEAARIFDETVYGGRPADAAADARLRAVDDEVRATRVVGAA